MLVTKCNQSNATEMSGEELTQQLEKISRSATSKCKSLAFYCLNYFYNLIEKFAMNFEY